MPDFQPTNPQHARQLLFEGAWPMAVTFVGSSRRVAAGNREGQIYVWDVPESPEQAGAQVWPARRLEGHTNGISRLAATPDGKLLVSASLDRTIRLWDMQAPASGTAEAVLDIQSRQAEAKRKGKQDLLEAPGVAVAVNTAAHVLEGHADWIQALALSPDGRRLLTGDDSAVAIAWDLAERKAISRWQGHPWNWIVAVAISADGETALVSEYRYKRDDFDIPAPALRLYHVADGSQKLDILKTHLPKLDATATSYGAAQAWRPFVGHGLVAAAFSPDGKLVALGQGGEIDTGKVHLMDAATGKLVRTISGHQYGVTDLLFTPDGQHLLSTGRDTTVRICQVEDGKELLKLGEPRGGQFKDWFSALALSPDQQAIAAADIAGKVHVWQWGD
jgi:WD40 repeat protein